jgi:hypothetical protein
MNHPALDELVGELSAIRALERGSPGQLERLRRLRDRCPAFVPGLLMLASSTQLSDEQPAASETGPFAEVDRVLGDAKQASSPSDCDALVESGHLAWAVLDDAPRALKDLEQVEARLRTLLEDVLATKVRVLLELGEVARARAVVTEALLWFPFSAEVQRAHEESRRE